MSSHRHLQQWLKQQCQSKKPDHQWNVLPFILVIGKDGKSDHCTEPKELIVTIRHMKKAYDQHDGEGNFYQIFEGEFHFHNIVWSNLTDKFDDVISR